MSQLNDLPQPVPHLQCPACKVLVRCMPCEATTHLERVLKGCERALRLHTEFEKSEKMKVETLRGRWIIGFLTQMEAVLAMECTPQQMARIERHVEKLPVVAELTG